MMRIFWFRNEPVPSMYLSSYIALAWTAGQRYSVTNSSLKSSMKIYELNNIFIDRFFHKSTRYPQAGAPHAIHRRAPHTLSTGGRPTRYPQAGAPHAIHRRAPHTLSTGGRPTRYPQAGTHTLSTGGRPTRYPQAGAPHAIHRHTHIHIFRHIQICIFRHTQAFIYFDTQAFIYFNTSYFCDRTTKFRHLKIWS